MQILAFAPKDKARRSVLERARRTFIGIFGFDPKELNVYGRKKEVIILMASSADRLRASAKQYAGSASGRNRQRYHGRLDSFDWARATLAAFDPNFARQLPHWTEFPNNVDAWIQGARVEVRPVVGELELLPPPKLDQRE